MKKTIRIMSIMSVALAGLSLILILVSIPFQSMIAQQIYEAPENYRDALPQFPLIPFLTCLLRTACLVLLIICCGKKNRGIWLELLIICCLVIIIPAISQIASRLYTRSLYDKTLQYHYAKSVATQIAGFFSIPSDWGQALAYVTCGMSIAFKKISKKINQAVTNE